jgi:hypothetical protein
VERLGARLRWEGFISGTVGSPVATLPEVVVIAFLVRVEPLAAFITTVVTICNNALAFSVYSFFLPKDWLLPHIEEGHALSNLDAVAMTAVYVLLLYFLFTAPAMRP